MSPIEIPDVNAMNVWAYITIGIVAIAILCFILAIVDKSIEAYSNANGKPVISLTWWALTKTGAILLLVSLPFYVVSDDMYNADLQTASADTLSKLEQETDVVILNKESISYTDIVQEVNSVPVSFKHKENLYEGVLIIEDGSMLLHVENTSEGERQLVVFGS